MKGSNGIHDIPLKFIRLVSSYISPHLSTLFNLCIDRGKFPSIFKISTINPIFKKDSRKVIDNHRPVSILSNISKIFENLINKQLSGHFLSSNILSGN